MLDRLAAAMAHRGPDGVGKFLAGPVGLVSTRLAIIDLETGDQPLFDRSGRGPGRQRRDLQRPGDPRRAGLCALADRSDCESVLKLYRRDGADLLSDLRGMYAIALLDPARGRLVLARDPFGIKQLYCVETDA